SIAADSSDNVHISYMDKQKGQLKYATNASGGWVVTKVDSSNGIIGEYASIALDSKDKVHISYSDYTDGCIKYATNASGDWVMTTLENYTSASNPFSYTSVAIDSSDKVHLSYFEDDYLEQRLKYAVFTPPAYDATGTWNYSESNNWASSGCRPDADETGTLKITQLGNSVTQDSTNGTWNGSVSGKSYYFSMPFWEADGKTTYYADFALSSDTSGSGTITWKQENGCEGGKNITLNIQSLQHSPESSGSGGDSSGGGGCFIATAAYGSLMEPHVKTLRDFRDRFLITSTIGNFFVKLYYKYSPPFANFIAKHSHLRAIVRIGLFPVAGLSWIALKIGLFSTISIMLFFLSCFVGFFWSRRRHEN
ncbi:MAG: CFI-box-CTERM domain-containing protein, partial [Desulfobacterales bacterium]